MLRHSHTTCWMQVPFTSASTSLLLSGIISQRDVSPVSLQLKYPSKQAKVCRTNPRLGSQVLVGFELSTCGIRRYSAHYAYTFCPSKEKHNTFSLYPQKVFIILTVVQSSSMPLVYYSHFPMFYL